MGTASAPADLRHLAGPLSWRWRMHCSCTRRSERLRNLPGGGALLLGGDGSWTAATAAHDSGGCACYLYQVEIAWVGGRGHYFMRCGGEGFPRTLSAALFPGTILPVPLSPHSGSGRAWQGGRCRAPCPFSSPCRILLCSCMETGSGEGRKASSGVATAAPQYAGAEGVNRGCELGMRPLCIQFRCE